MRLLAKARGLITDILSIWKLPSLTINLMYNQGLGNDPFYSTLVKQFYIDACSRHPKYLLIRKFTRGVAVCPLPPTFDIYFADIEASARRNYKKAVRNGYSFSRIEHDEHLDDITAIRQSARERQGEMGSDFLTERAHAVNNPRSNTPYHDYPYFGIQRDGVLRAYAGCFVAGQICMLEQILGHASFQSDGIVPMLIISIADYMLKNHPAVRYFSYGTFFGARETMRRFKTKLGFVPHHVTWVLGDTP